MRMTRQIGLLLLASVCLLALNMQARADLQAASLADSESGLDAERALDAGDYAKAAKLLSVAGSGTTSVT